MNQIFAIGKEQIGINIPDENVMAVLHANLPDIPLDEQKTITDALENPIGTPRLREIVKPGEKVVIVTSDYQLPRSMALAEDMGLEASGVGSPCLQEYWLKNHGRETLSWIKYWLKKYLHLNL